MRTVIVGLALCVGIVGGAEAKGCRIGQTIVVAKDTKFSYGGVTKVERPDLVGQRFRVARYVSKPREPNKPGYDAYELKGARGSFVVRRDYLGPGNLPGTQPTSYAAGGGDVDWNAKSVRTVPASQIGDYLLDGPLSALTLEARGCK